MIAKKSRTAWAGWILLGLLGSNADAGQDEAALNAALKQVTKAFRDVRGVVADIEVTEVVDNVPVNGTGKLYVHFFGYMRAEIGGDQPRTILFSWPHLYVYRPAENVVEIDDLTENPHRLAQYVMLGFVPAGKELTKRYHVQLVENAMIDGKPTFNFLITPKAKKAYDETRAIARIQLWSDAATGFPARHQIIHSAGVTELDVRYLAVSRDDTLPDSLFKPEWPEGTTVIRR